MKGDFTRSTFKPGKHYSGVRMQQGRVQLDADWNEQLDIDAHRSETETIDVIGGCGAPMHDAGFSLTNGPIPKIGYGRYYVDGILCESDANVDLDKQPDLPVAALGDLITPKSNPPPDGLYLAYLDVWQRHITALEDDGIREIALGGPDTATRTKTLRQVKLLGPFPAPLTCVSEPALWKDLLDRTQDGKLSARAAESAGVVGPCVVPPGAGYRRLENQLYRVEIHEVDAGGAIKLLKWSRDNGSIVTRWLKQEASKPSELIVSSIGRDSVLGFGPGQYLEVVDDARELRGEAGILVKLANAEGQVLTLDVINPIALGVDKTKFPDQLNGQPNNPKARRWDGVVATPAPGNWLDLEDGVQIKFEAGAYHVGDYWLIPARTATADVEWPRDTANPPTPIPKPRAGIDHHHCKLAILSRAGGSFTVVQDCRELFPPLTELVTLLYVGGDGQEAMPGNPLPQPLRARVVNGQAPVIGAQVKFTVTQGGGNLSGAQSVVSVTTAPDGAADCDWALGGAGAQQVDAVLLDAGDSPVPGQVLRFTANLSIASQVAYDPAQCNNLAGAATVQDAIDRLCRLVGAPSEPGIRIEKLEIGGLEFHNDAFYAPTALADGIRVFCDSDVARASVDGRGISPSPVCFVTLDLPYPLTPQENEFWRNFHAAGLLGHTALKVASTVRSEGRLIEWHPLENADSWLRNSLLSAVQKVAEGLPVLAHLTIKGNFIWGPDDPKFHLDGEVLGIPGRDRTEIMLPSGNDLRGGDFEAWFWLGDLRIGLIPRRDFVAAAVAPRFVQALNMALARDQMRPLLPDEYQLAQGQPFDPAKSKRLITELGLQGKPLLVWASQPNEHLAQATIDMLANNAGLAPQLAVVPGGEGDLLNVLITAVAAGEPVDMVIGPGSAASMLARQAPNQFDGSMVLF